MSIFKVIAPDGVVYQPHGPGSTKRVAAGELLVLDDSIDHLVGTQIGKHQVQRIDPSALQSAVDRATPPVLDSNGGTGEGTPGPNPLELEATEAKELSKELLPAYLEARTRDELREIAQAGGIDIPGNSSKAAFIEAILAKSAEEAGDQQ